MIKFKALLRSAYPVKSNRLILFVTPGRETVLQACFYVPDLLEAQMVCSIATAEQSVGRKTYCLAPSSVSSTSELSTALHCLTIPTMHAPVCRNTSALLNRHKEVSMSLNGPRRTNKM